MNKASKGAKPAAKAAPNPQNSTAPKTKTAEASDSHEEENSRKRERDATSKANAPDVTAKAPRLDADSGTATVQAKARGRPKKAGATEKSMAEDVDSSDDEEEDAQVVTTAGVVAPIAMHIAATEPAHTIVSGLTTAPAVPVSESSLASIAVGDLTNTMAKPLAPAVASAVVSAARRGRKPGIARASLSPLGKIKSRSSLDDSPGSGPGRRQSVAYTYPYEMVKAALVKLTEIKGNLAVRKPFSIPEEPAWPVELWGMRLGLVVRKIKDGHLYPDKRDELRALGLQIDTTRHANYGFDMIKSGLLKYKEIYGDMNVGRAYVVPDNDPRWPPEMWKMTLGSCLRDMKRDKCYVGRKNEILSLGYDFNVYPRQRAKRIIVQVRAPKKKPVKTTRSDRLLSALQTYKNIYGDLRVPTKFVVPKEDPAWPDNVRGMKLGIYVQLIRMGRSCKNRKDDLLAMGFSFDNQRMKYGYEAVKRALLRYKEIKGDLHVKQKFVTPNNSVEWPEDLWGMKLGNALHDIKQGDSYRNMRGDLEAIGVSYYKQSAVKPDAPPKPRGRRKKYVPVAETSVILVPVPSGEAVGLTSYDALGGAQGFPPSMTGLAPAPVPVSVSTVPQMGAAPLQVPVQGLPQAPPLVSGDPSLAPLPAQQLPQAQAQALGQVLAPVPVSAQPQMVSHDLLQPLPLPMSHDAHLNADANVPLFDAETAAALRDVDVGVGLDHADV